MNLRALLTLLAAALLVALGWWLQDLIRPPELSETALPATSPDYYMDVFTLTAMNMAHYPDDDHSDLAEPHLIIFRTDGAPWRLDSDRGRASGDGTLVNLLGAVHMTRARSPTNRPVSIDTRNVLVRPDDNYAETAEPVFMKSEMSRLQGVGMHAYLKVGRLELLSQVRGLYESENP
jgi:lipopolysaccharide export system protein LptC